ncbi:MAG: sensor histidine kinase [Chloroflexota bacterium]
MIEPGLLRVFRYFSGVAVVYFSILLSYSGIQQVTAGLTYQIQAYLNLATYLALFGYLSWSWLRKKLKQLYLPVALAGATFIPIFSNLVYLADPEAQEMTTLITRSWLLVPILLVPFALAAWQYSFKYVVLLIAVSTLIELSVLLPFIDVIDYDSVVILGVPIVRAFAFGMIGNIVSMLIDTQREQRRQMLRANLQLSEYALALEHLTETRERNRLARELHDTLAHTLSGLSVNLEAIKIMLNADQVEIFGMIEHALDNTRQGLDNTRRALKSLRTKAIEEFGLEIALQKLSETCAERGGFVVKSSFPEAFPVFSPDEEQTIYRIAQEAFENIVQHSNAGEVDFQLAVENGEFKMIIKDNGGGFPPDALLADDIFGVRGMQERAKMVKGRLTIESAPEQGTQVEYLGEVIDD